MKAYHVIGLMSGTSLDGVDLAYCTFTYKQGNWIYKLFNTATISYPEAWLYRLNTLKNASAIDYIAADQAYGAYLGELVNKFIAENNLTPDFISSHGHTIFHQPARNISHQLGNGAYLAAKAGVPVVCDFRTLDIALGGQGAPLVPIGDKLLFADYDFCLNLGGIANISSDQHGKRLAYDLCACNMLLNQLANQLNLEYDKDGEMARSGELNQNLLQELNEPAYFKAAFPKSLGKEWVDENSLKTLNQSEIPVRDKLHTVSHHIAFQIAEALKTVPKTGKKAKLLVTGGGAFNTFLVELISQYAGNTVEVIVPEPELVNFKEALVFAFLGVLRWQNEINCLASVTGAKEDNCGGAIYYTKPAE